MLKKNSMLYNHQQKILDLNPPKHLLCWGTGTGKTIGALSLAYKNTNNILIICPKALFEQWKRHTERDDLGRPKHCAYRIMTKETFRKEWDTVEYCEGIIVDEAHYFSGIQSHQKQSDMYRSLMAYIKKHNPPFIWLLTATPYLSTPLNILALSNILGYQWPYWKFHAKYFDRFRLGKSSRWVSRVKSGIESEMARLVNIIGSTVHINECADIPDQVFETEYFQLTEDQTKAIKKVTESEINHIVKFTKFHQVENGTLKGDEYEPNQFFETEKNERIVELCQQNKKVAVFCRYNLQIDSLKETLEKATNRPVYVIRGDVKNRDEVVQAAEKADECIILINASCSEGYELPSIGLIIYASLSFSFKDYKQSLGRFLRLNRLKKNVYIHLVTAEGIDEAVYQSILKKQDFDIAIYSKEHATGK